MTVEARIAPLRPVGLGEARRGGSTVLATLERYSGL